MSQAAMPPSGRGPSKDQIQHLMGKAITDEKFRERLFTSPKEAAAEVGIAFNDQQVQLLQQMKPTIDQQAAAPQQALLFVLIPIADVAIVAYFA